MQGKFTDPASYSEWLGSEYSAYYHLFSEKNGSESSIASENLEIGEEISIDEGTLL